MTFDIYLSRVLHYELKLPDYLKGTIFINDDKKCFSSYFVKNILIQDFLAIIFSSRTSDEIQFLLFLVQLFLSLTELLLEKYNCYY